MGAVPPPGVDINQGGVLKKSRTQKINFVSGATVVDNGDSADVTVTGGGGAGSGVNTLDQGVAVDTPATAINFAGGGVKTTGGAGTSTVTIPGSQFGTAAARPAAAASNRGEFYFSTDTGIVTVSDGSAWQAVVPSIAAGGTGQTTQQAAIDALTGTQSLAKYLRSDGTHATLSALAAADLTGTQAGVDSSAVHSGDAAGGDLTGTYPSPTVGTNKITNAKAAQMAANTIKGNNTGGAANAADLTAAQVKTLLAIATGDVSGLGTLATVNSPTPVANGGTGLTALPGAGKVDVSDGSVFVAGNPQDIGRLLALEPSGVIASNCSRLYVVHGSISVTSGTLLVAAIGLSKGQVLTSLAFATGAVTALGAGTHQIFGLYDSSKNLLATTTDDTSTAWAVNTIKTLNFTPGTFTTTYTGLYYLGLLVVATTAPGLLGTPSDNANPMGFTPQMGGPTNNTGITALPNPFGTITNSASVLWGMVK